MTTRTDEWWDRLYAPTDEPEPDAGRAPVPASSGRLPDWRRGEVVELTGDEPAPDTAEEPAGTDTAASDTEDEDCPDTDTTPDTADTDTKDSGQPDTPPARTPRLVPVPDYYPTPKVSAVRPALSAGTRRALYNAGAAGAGWGLGLVPLLDHALDSCGRDASIGAALLLGVGGCLAVAHLWDRRTRHWWAGLAWAARIPLASAVTALALWAPASTL